MRPYQKTEFGYIAYRKRRQFFMTVLMAIIGFLIYFSGCALNKGENTNIFTIVAILMVLPGAKFFVNLVVLWPYHTPKKEKKEGLEQLLGGRGSLWSDLVITSPEKVMNLDFLWIEEGCVLAVAGKADQNLSYIQKYLAQGVRNWASSYRVKIYAEYEEFYKGIKEEIKRPEKESTEELEKAMAYLKSLIV